MSVGQKLKIFFSDPLPPPYNFRKIFILYNPFVVDLNKKTSFMFQEVRWHRNMTIPAINFRVSLVKHEMPLAVPGLIICMNSWKSARFKNTNMHLTALLYYHIWYAPYINDATHFTPANTYYRKVPQGMVGPTLGCGLFV